MKVTRITDQWKEASDYQKKILMNTAYGKQWVPSNLKKIIKWKFQIESFAKYRDDDGIVYLGIVSKDGRLNDNFSARQDWPFAHFEIRDNSWSDWRNYQVTIKRKRHYYLVLDTLNWRLSIQEEGDKQICSKNISSFPRDGTKYKLAISMPSQGAKFVLIDFQIN